MNNELIIKYIKYKSMNTNVRTKNFGLNPKMVFLILCMFVGVFPALSQNKKKDNVIVLSNEKEKEKVFAPDGVELPDWFNDWKIKYNVHYIPVADLTLYERPDARDRTVLKEKHDRNRFVLRETPDCTVVVNENCEPVRRSNNSAASVEKIERNEDETLVTLKVNIYWDWNWLFFDKKTCLIDTLTGDKYMLRDIQGAHEPGRLSVVYGLQGRAILQTLVFPPLKQAVEVIDFYEPDNFKDTPPGSTNGGGYREYDIVISDYTKQNKKYPNAEIIY
jgi:hypothetical protein